jgi:hypothetical protein
MWEAPFVFIASSGQIICRAKMFGEWGKWDFGDVRHPGAYGGLAGAVRGVEADDSLGGVNGIYTSKPSTHR